MTIAGTSRELNVGTSTQKEEISQDCIVMPIWKDASYFDSPSKDVGNGEPKSVDDQKQVEDGTDNENDEKDNPEVNTDRFKLNTVDPSVRTASSNNQDIPKDMFKLGASHTLKTTHVEFFSDEDEPEVDLGNILNSYTFPTTPNTRIHKDYLIKNVIGDVKSSIQTRRMTKPTSKQGFLIEPNKYAKALSDSSWVEAIQEELLQFKLQQVWILVDLPIGKRAIGTKRVFRNKKDERGIMIRNKARLVAQGHRQEEGIDYEEVFAPVARLKAIRLFLAYDSFMGFLVYQMDMKSAFLYGTIEEEITQKEEGIFISQDKYVAKILKKFNYIDVKSASTPIDLEKPLVKDGDADDVDVHLLRSRIKIFLQKVLMLEGSVLGLKSGDEAVHKELGDRMERAVTIASSLEAKQDSYAQTRFETTSKQSNDPPLSRVNTLRSGEDSMKLLELMELCTKLSDLFWASAKEKTINGERQLQALVDKKKVIIMESSIRSDHHLEDACGTDCLPTATIFEELARMSAKTTAWNEFSSTMTYAIICLATNQKINLSKYIFDAMIRIDQMTHHLLILKALPVTAFQYVSYLYEQDDSAINM
ncbi:putative ribonuclease H-like domain-containing protein [Tanacetum coccineum]